MQASHTYRAQADFCVRQSEHAKTSQHRVIRLDMAQTWLRMADDADAINIFRISLEELDKAS